jgi:hypothetical protein
VAVLVLVDLQAADHV